MSGGRRGHQHATTPTHRQMIVEEQRREYPPPKENATSYHRYRIASPRKGTKTGSHVQALTSRGAKSLAMLLLINCQRHILLFATTAPFRRARSAIGIVRSGSMRTVPLPQRTVHGRRVTRRRRIRRHRPGRHPSRTRGWSTIFWAIRIRPRSTLRRRLEVWRRTLSWRLIRIH